MLWGTSGIPTELRNDAGTGGGVSGFETNTPVNFYPNASSWQHLLEARHSNTGNNYALQIGGSFFDQDLWFRKTNNNGAAKWQQIIGAGPRPCTPPFHAMSATVSHTVGSVTRENTLCGSQFFPATNFQNAQSICYAMGGHVQTYSEAFMFAQAVGLPNGHVMLNGDWLGNRTIDDMVMVRQQ